MALEGCRAKSGRAKHHLETLEQRIRAFLNSNPYPVAVESHADEGRYVVRLEHPPMLPGQDWALIIGDCVHNLRSSLDYIAWELAGARPDDTLTMFPIYADKAAFRKDGLKRLRHVRSEAQALLESLQPYSAASPKLTALWAIHHLDAADKHRLLTVTASIQDEIAISFVDVPPHTRVRYRLDLLPNVSLEHNAVIAEVTLTTPIPQAKVKAEFSPEIAFGESLGFGLRAYVLPSLSAFCQEVDGVIARFDPFFVQS